MDEARRVSELEQANQSNQGLKPNLLSTRPARDDEAGAGIEPANSGFADRSLTTWLPRREWKLSVTRDGIVSIFARPRRAQ